MAHQKISIWPIIASVALLVSGCRGSEVSDLHLARIEMIGQGREGVPPELSGWNPQGGFVKLIFATDSNVRGLASRLSLHLRADAYFCGNRDHELAIMQMVFDSEGIIGESPTPSRREGGGEVWIFVADSAGPMKAIGSGRFTNPAYDLRELPQDVCVQLHGRNMALEGFSSNVVAISGAKLTEALARSSKLDRR